MPTSRRPDPLSSLQQPRHRARGAEAGVRDVQCKRDAVRSPKRSTLRILADGTVNDLILEPHVTAFLSAHPSLSIALERRSMTGGHGRAGPDLILRYEPSASAGGGGDILHTQSLLTCAAPHYLRERGLPHHPRDLRGISDALVVSDDPGAPLPWRFENAGQGLSIKPQIRAATPSPSTALALAVAGAGFTQIPECWAIDHVRTGRLVRLLPEWEPSIHLRPVTRSGGADARAFVRFIRTLLEAGGPGRTVLPRSPATRAVALH
jgi:DNA-binding transcriptional LysR family regulator